ncbi:MAG: stage III sporulation protein AE [Oscillospiraceae bacterium]|nr:stage III sporulation protein AE [Oscillospiraceae bacterium]
MRKTIILLLLALLLAVPVNAADVTGELTDLFGASSLEDGLDADQQELLGENKPTESTGFFHAVQELFAKAILGTGSDLRSAAAMAAMVLAVCMVCGLCGTLPGAPTVRAVTMAGLLGIAAVCASGVNSLLQLGTETIGDMVSFSQLLLPVLSAATISSGAITSGGAIYGITVLFSDLLMGCVTKVLIPMTYVLLALALADCALGNSMLRRFRELLSWLIRTGLKAIVYTFTGFVTITQVISGTADTMTAKAAKLTLSSVVPVVGGIISDATDTVLVSAALLKSSIGVFGMLAILAICVVPFFRIGIHYLIMKVTAAIAGAVAEESLTSMVDAVGEAMGLLLGMTGACALLLLISTVCSLKAVGY